MVLNIKLKEVIDFGLKVLDGLYSEGKTKSMKKRLPIKYEKKQ
jgi:hypothetical protein